VRENDGLALSSRNVYLDAPQRSTATALSRSLNRGAAAALRGDLPAAVVAAARTELERAGLVPDYVEVTDPGLGPAPAEGPARLLVAAPVGRTRLLDNAALTLPGSGEG
jgi:pantoate--beta-alanine ligase